LDKINVSIEPLNWSRIDINLNSVKCIRSLYGRNVLVKTWSQMFTLRVNCKHRSFLHLLYSSKVNKISLKLVLEVSDALVFCYIVLINMLEFKNSIWQLVQSRVLVITWWWLCWWLGSKYDLYSQSFVDVYSYCVNSEYYLYL
jgi:hypothetical protein